MADDHALHRPGTPCWVVLVTPDVGRTGPGEKSNTSRLNTSENVWVELRFIPVDVAVLAVTVSVPSYVPLRCGCIATKMVHRAPGATMLHR